MPDDCRDLIDRLQSGGLDLDDTADILAAASTQQTNRQQWIIRNWPHIVEYQEINRTLATGSWGPDPLMLDALGGTSLEPAVRAGASWLRAALCAIATTDQTTLHASQVDWLEAVAQFRSEHAITAIAPLGTSDLALDSSALDLRTREAAITAGLVTAPDPARNSLDRTTSAETTSIGLD